MGEGTTPDFVVAVAYCLAYDRWGHPPDRDALNRLRAGGEPQTDEERLLKGMLDAARSALEEPSADRPPVKPLQEVQEKAQALGDPKVGLIMGGATKVKQYVFESAKLPEIRGASALLDRINLVDLPALFNRLPSDPEQNKHALKVRGQFEARHGTRPPDCPDCVIYANGGEILTFAPTTLAPALADEIEFLYTAETLVANSVAVWRPCSLVELRFGLRPLEFAIDDMTRVPAELRESLLRDYYGQLDLQSFLSRKTFGEVPIALALEKLRRREGNEVRDRRPKPVPHIETNPYARRCQSCERRNAVVERRFEGEADGDWFCEPCARRRVFGQRAKKEGTEQTNWFKKAGSPWEPQGAEAWASRFVEWLTQSGLEQKYYQGSDKHSTEPADDLEDIAAAGKPEGFIGVIYADANNMGAMLETLTTPAEYRRFAEAVYQATQDATFAALASHLQPAKGKHPFEVLSIGGDDVFLIVPAHTALPIAIGIADEVNKRLCHDPIAGYAGGYKWEAVHRIRADGREIAPQSKVAFSSGVIIADQHTPVFLLRRLTEELLKSAKAKAKRLRERDPHFYGATIDFLSLKSIGMVATNVKDFRESALRRNNLHLTAKPYTVLELKALRQSAKTLKVGNFPRSQLYHLREQLQKGCLPSTVDYLYFLARSPHADEVRQALDGVWVGESSKGRVGEIGLWLRRNKDEWETILGDLVEIYDFVPEEES